METATALRPITIKVPENIYNAAKESAISRGYLSIEEYVSDWLEVNASLHTSITRDIALALHEGLEDSRAERIVGSEEHERQYEELRMTRQRAHKA